MQNIDIERNLEIDGKTDNRLYFFDNLRASIIILVIAFHAGMGYMSPQVEWWYVNDTQHNPLFNVFVMITDVFIMPIMFLIAGYLALPILQKKGVSKFWKEKTSRIVIPWILGVLFLAPAITYMIWYSRTSTPPEYFSYLLNTFFSTATFNHAHYWFLGDLTWFFLLLTVAYRFKPFAFQRKAVPVAPTAGFFLLFGLLTAATFFVANLFFSADQWLSKAIIISFQPTRLFIYLCYFSLGAYAWRNLWFTKAGYNPHLTSWLKGAILMLVVFTTYRIIVNNTAPVGLKVGHALVHSFFCLTIVFALIALFQKYCDSKAYIWRRLSANSYTIYYIHQLILLPIAYMVQKSPVNVWLKYVFVATSAILLCCLISEYLIGRFFGLGKDKGQLTGKIIS